MLKSSGWSVPDPAKGRKGTPAQAACTECGGQIEKKVPRELRREPSTVISTFRSSDGAIESLPRPAQESSSLNPSSL